MLLHLRHPMHILQLKFSVFPPNHNAPNLPTPTLPPSGYPPTPLARHNQLPPRRPHASRLRPSSSIPRRHPARVQVQDRYRNLQLCLYIPTAIEHIRLLRAYRFNQHLRRRGASLLGQDNNLRPRLATRIISASRLASSGDCGLGTRYCVAELLASREDDRVAGSRVGGWRESRRQRGI